MKKILFLPLLLLSLLTQAQLSLPNLKPYIGAQIPSNPVPNQRAGATQIRAAFNAVVDQLIGFDSSRVAHQTLAQLRSTSLSSVLAPKSIELLDPLRAGLFQLDLTDTTSPDDGAMVLVNQGSLRYKRVPTGTGINVKWFGAYGDNIHDDAPAINACIAFCKALLAQYILKNVFIPEGQYLCNSIVNGANATGLNIIGVPGRSFNTALILNTGSIGVDLSGSSESSLRNLTLSIPNGLSNPAKVALQLALSKNSVNQATSGAQKGGLNCVLSDIAIKMGDFVGINGGLGGIGLMVCRSEELAIHSVTIQANTPAVFTTTNALQPYTGYNYTVLSPNVPIQDDAVGSMGVVNWTGQNSLYVWEHETPALLLNGVNTHQFTGYISRLNNSTGGSYETAIRVTQQTYNLTINATVEGFGTLLNTQNRIDNSFLQFVTANATNPTKSVVVLENGSGIWGSTLSVSFGNLGEYNNGRMLLYTPAVNGGNDPTTASLKSCVINCPQLTANDQVISANLLKQTDNTRFSSANPFEKVGPYVRLIGNGPRTFTTVSPSGTTTATLCHFTVADKADKSNGSSGFYEAKVSGVLQLGDYNTFNGPAFYEFEATILRGQRGDGVALATDVKIVPKGQVTFNGAYLAITGISLDMTVSGSTGTIMLTATTGGSGTGEGVTFSGEVKLATNLKVNQALITD